MKKILTCTAAVIMLMGCNKNENERETSTPYDYSLASNWMVQDFNGKDFDVFYVYPTVVWKGNTDAADLSEEEKKDAHITYLEGPECMSEYANMYAPYFRQATMDYLLPLDDSDQMMDVVRGAMGKQDLFAALDYYFDHFNCGRPFILASHGQGTAMLRTVFEEYATKDETHENYFKRMIAAYMLGFSVPKTWLSENGLEGAKGADDTGVIIAYNTEGPGATKPSILVTSDDYEINPLTWSTDTDKADASINKGSFKWEDQATYLRHIQNPGECDAQIDDNRAALICTTVTEYVNIQGFDDPFGDKSLHGYEWPGYYANIKQNAKIRIDAYMATH